MALPKITLRFANPSYLDGKYTAQVEATSNIPDMAIFGCNLRFFYDTGLLKPSSPTIVVSHTSLPLGCGVPPLYDHVVYLPHDLTILLGCDVLCALTHVSTHCPAPYSTPLSYPSHPGLGNLCWCMIVPIGRMVIESLLCVWL